MLSWQKKAPKKWKNVRLCSFYCNCNVLIFLATMLQTGFFWNQRCCFLDISNFPLNRGLSFFSRHILFENVKMAWMSYQGLCGRCAIVQATSKGETRPILGRRRVETTTFGEKHWICGDRILYAMWSLQDGGSALACFFLDLRVIIRMGWDYGFALKMNCWYGFCWYILSRKMGWTFRRVVAHPRKPHHFLAIEPPGDDGIFF